MPIFLVSTFHCKNDCHNLSKQSITNCKVWNKTTNTLSMIVFVDAYRSCWSWIALSYAISITLYPTMDRWLSNNLNNFCVLWWWVSILKAFKITKSKIVGPFVSFVLPDREAWVVIIAIIAFLASLGFFFCYKNLELLNLIISTIPHRINNIK